ncbi:MAG: hypothetical protein HKN82_06510 [Akkermansiaceae bacterium]|nr:hypothetical protein [Akkermansiaceae bacterium]
MFVFGRPDVQELLHAHFVTVAADDWYQRRRDDPVGRFFRSVADQGPRKGEGGGTRQGRYVFTASGKLLGFNNNRDPERILKMLRESLVRWKALPAAERTPGAVEVPALGAGDLDAKFVRTPPPGGLVVAVRTRPVTRRPGGEFAACEVPGDAARRFANPGFAPASDHLWITARETAALAATTRAGPLDPALAHRLLRFHLVDNTRGEPPHWDRPEIKALDLAVHPPTRESPGRLVLRGSFRAASADGTRGIDGNLLGTISFDPATKACRRFEVVALADHWGEGRYTPGARPGRTPLVVAFSLADPQDPDYVVPPQGIRWEQGYYQADRH